MLSPLISTRFSTSTESRTGAAISHKNKPNKKKKGDSIYNAENAAQWTLRFVQLANDLNLPNAGSEVGKGGVRITLPKRQTANRTLSLKMCFDL